MKQWTGLNWLNIGSNFRIYEYGNEPSGLKLIYTTTILSRNTVLCSRLHKLFLEDILKYYNPTFYQISKMFLPQFWTFCSFLQAAVNSYVLNPDTCLSTTFLNILSVDIHVFNPNILRTTKSSNTLIYTSASTVLIDYVWCCLVPPKTIFV